MLLAPCFIALTAVSAVAQIQSCPLIVTAHWPKSEPTGPDMRDKTRHEVFDAFGVALNSVYKDGGYASNPKSFPVDHTDFRGDHIVVQFRVSCGSAHVLLAELLDKVKSSLHRSGAAGMPELAVKKAPATEYEVRCGVGATVRTCPPVK
jgi:hypothetical protein